MAALDNNDKEKSNSNNYWDNGDCYKDHVSIWPFVIFHAILLPSHLSCYCISLDLIVVFKGPAPPLLVCYLDDDDASSVAQVANDVQ